MIYPQSVSLHFYSVKCSRCVTAAESVFDATCVSCPSGMQCQSVKSKRNGGALAAWICVHTSHQSRLLGLHVGVGLEIL